jgi:hypothetical protein
LTLRQAFLIRLLISIVLGLLAAVLVSEIAFRLLGNTTSRAPQVVVLVIPPGASEKVSEGEVILPAEQVFVVGDTLVVYNEDSVTHTLGPLFIPAGSSASLFLSEPENLSYSCSFQPTKMFGLDVREPLTLSLRVQGILIAGVPMGFLFFVYSLVLRPLKKKEQPV